MLNTTYTKNILTALFNHNKAASTNANSVTFPYTPYLALYTAMAYDSSTGSYTVTEVPATADSKSTGYARKLMTGVGIYGDDPLTSASMTARLTFTASEITITTETAVSRGDQTFKIYYKISGSDTIYNVEIIVPAGTTTGNSTSNLADGSSLQSGTIVSVSFTDGTGYGKQVISYITNRDVVAIGECINAAWAGQADSKFIVGFGICGASSGSSYTFVGELTTPIHVEIGQIPIFRVGDFRIIID